MQRTSQSPQEEESTVNDDQSYETTESEDISSESDSERPKKTTVKKRHEKNLKDQRIVNIDKKINTPWKL